MFIKFQLILLNQFQSMQGYWLKNFFNTKPKKVMSVSAIADKPLQRD